MKCIYVSENKNYIELDWEGRVIEMRKKNDSKVPNMYVARNLYMWYEFS